MSSYEKVSRRHGVQVVGVLSAGIGLGAAGRSTLRVLDQRRIEHVAVDVALNGQAIKEEPPGSASRFPSLAGMPFDVSVFQLNPDSFDILVLRWARRCGLDLLPTVNAVVPFWELPELPASWVSVLGLFDVVLAPSAFVREAIVASMPELNRPIILDYPQALAPPAIVRPDRARWFGESANNITFLCTFDLLSDIQRKNPWAAIDAFRSAFVGRDDVTLLIKVGHAGSSEHANRFAQLSGVAAGDKRIVLMSTPLSRDDMWSLSASADAYVSLHRSEGLGLGLMEAMAVGTPVVATGWSGNVDFMDETNSLLVPYDLIAVDGVSHPLYAGESSQRWADPDIDAAADALRSLADSPELRQRLGAAAQRSMQARWERQSEPGVFDELLALAASGLADTSQHAARVEAATRYVRKQTLAPSNLIASAKRTGVRALRRIGLKPPAPADEHQWGPPDILT